MNRREMAAALVLAVAAGTAQQAHAAKAPTTWDGLVRVKSKKLKFVYLQPGADFRTYRSVIVEPTEVAFEKNWVKDYNSSTVGLQSRVSEKEVAGIVKEAIAKATDLFEEAYGEGGYPVVQAPGPEVLKVRTGIINVRVTAPERQMAGRSYSFADEAGTATFVVEVRDSETNALLGRAVDGRVAGDTTVGWRNRVTNRGDFRQLVKSWAKISVNGLNELKTLSPINEEGLKRA